MVGSSFGTHDNSKFTFTGRINLQAGVNKVSLLSIAGGLPVSFPAPIYHFQTLIKSLRIVCLIYVTLVSWKLRIRKILIWINSSQLKLVLVWFFFSFSVDEEQWPPLWGERNGSAWTSGYTWIGQRKNGLI